MKLINKTSYQSDSIKEIAIIVYRGLIKELTYTQIKNIDFGNFALLVDHSARSQRIRIQHRVGWHPGDVLWLPSKKYLSNVAAFDFALGISAILRLRAGLQRSTLWERAKYLNIFNDRDLPPPYTSQIANAKSEKYRNIEI